MKDETLKQRRPTGGPLNFKQTVARILADERFARDIHSLVDIQRTGSLEDARDAHDELERYWFHIEDDELKMLNLERGDVGPTKCTGTTTTFMLDFAVAKDWPEEGSR